MNLNKKKQKNNIIKKSLCYILRTVMFMIVISFVKIISNIFLINGVASQTEIYVDGNSTYQYIINADNTISITEWDGTNTEIVIPEKIDNKIVTSIEKKAFKGCSNLNKIDLPSGLKSIGEFAFDDCSNLKEIKLPSKVMKIENWAFDRCTSLVGIYVDPENEYYQSIEGVLFDKSGAELLRYPAGRIEENYVIPAKVRKIGNSAFDSCNNLIEVKLSPSVWIIEDFAFINCNKLISMKLPMGLYTIGAHAIGFEYDYIYTYKQIDNFKIYGYYNSEVQKYASNNNIDLIYYNTISDSNDITFGYIENTLEENMYLESKQFEKTDKEYINIKNKLTDTMLNPQDISFELYEISLMDNNDQKISLTDSIDVHIFQEFWEDKWEYVPYNVYKINEDGSLQNMNAGYWTNFMYNDSYVTFETDSCGMYIVTTMDFELTENNNIIYGDVNFDGIVDSSDVILIKKHLAGYKNLKINLKAGDVNADGKVDCIDAVKVLRKLAGYNIELGKG